MIALSRNPQDRVEIFCGRFSRKKYYPVLDSAEAYDKIMGGGSLVLFQ